MYCFRVFFTRSLRYLNGRTLSPFPAEAGHGYYPLNGKLAALLPFGKVADFLGEVLPVSAKTNASTVRNRAMRIGKWLERDRDQLRAAMPASRPKAIVLGLDGGYVKNRHPSPERNFEIVAGKVLGEAERQHRFAFVRGASSFGVEEISSLFRKHGVDSSTKITVLLDGDAGLRSIQRQVAPEAEHILDWFHIAMRFQNLFQLGKALLRSPATWNDGCWATMKLKRAKWALWNGQAMKTVLHLMDVHHWTLLKRGEMPLAITRLERPLYELIRYLFSNEDSLPNYRSGTIWASRFRVLGWNRP
ncbi:MAG: hypothetical protein ACR2JB_00795 [Bryobacteraceae bacterium]